MVDFSNFWRFSEALSNLLSAIWFFFGFGLGYYIRVFGEQRPQVNRSTPKTHTVLNCTHTGNSMFLAFFLDLPKKFLKFLQTTHSAIQNSNLKRKSDIEFYWCIYWCEHTFIHKQSYSFVFCSCTKLCTTSTIVYFSCYHMCVLFCCVSHFPRYRNSW